MYTLLTHLRYDFLRLAMVSLAIIIVSELILPGSLTRTMPLSAVFGALIISITLFPPDHRIVRPQRRTLFFIALLATGVTILSLLGYSWAALSILVPLCATLAAFALYMFPTKTS